MSVIHQSPFLPYVIITNSLKKGTNPSSKRKFKWLLTSEGLGPKVIFSVFVMLFNMKTNLITSSGRRLIDRTQHRFACEIFVREDQTHLILLYNCLITRLTSVVCMYVKWFGEIHIICFLNGVLVHVHFEAVCVPMTSINTLMRYSAFRLQTHIFGNIVIKTSNITSYQISLGQLEGWSIKWSFLLSELLF